MSTQLLIQVKQFLNDLEPAQDKMLQLFDSKRSAVTAAHSGEMLKLAESESELTEKMQEILRARHRILQQASREGFAGDTIEKLVASLGGDECSALQSRIEVARRKSEKIRRESWVQWVVSQRATIYYNELLELVAYCGEKAPTYTERPNQQTSGAAILDASI